MRLDNLGKFTTLESNKSLARLRPLTLTGELYEPFERADGGRASRLDLLRLSIAAITLMQHGLRSVVEFTLQLVQVALPKGRVIPEDFGEGG